VDQVVKHNYIIIIVIVAI